MSAKITVNVADFTLHPFAVRQVILTPSYKFSTEGNSIIAADRISQVTDVSGIAIFSGVTSGNYS